MASQAPTADELLAHREWLLALARALVGDASAPDIVQDTFEVALAKPPPAAGALRPWLGGVARNLAKMARRGGARREARETRAIDPHATMPSPDELVERARTQHEVAELVLALPEPLRGTLLLRYFEGLSAAEIARAQRIPAATVRGRLADALAQVRAALDAKHGKRAAWLALLAPLPIAATSSTASAATLGTGLLVKKLVITLVVVAIVIVGTRAAGMWGGGSSTPSPAPTPAGSGSGLVITPPAASPPAITGGTAVRTPEAPHDDDPTGTIRLEGQVIDDKDQPVGGARVAIDSNPPKLATSEDNGSFVFEGLIARDYRIEATVITGELGRYAGPVRLRLHPEPEPVTLRMREGGTIAVTVTDAATAKPIAGARVELRGTLVWSESTAASGVAKLRGVGAVWGALVVSAKGYAPVAQMTWASGEPAAPLQISVALGTGAAIAGKVIDDAGKPVAGARVVATNASEPFPVVDARLDGVVTKADGAFTIPAVAAGTWRLTATHGDRAPATSLPVTVDGEHAKDGVVLTLAAGGIVKGLVVDQAGAPVAAADVRVVVRGTTPWRATRQAFTGADGAFAIAGLPLREHDVVASHAGGSSAIVAIDLGAKREAEAKLVLDVLGKITGTVVDTTGEPIGDAQVIAVPEWSGGPGDRQAWSVRGPSETVTDQGGAFAFPGLPDGTYRLRAARPGATEVAIDLAVSYPARPGDTVKITLKADGKITGKVALPDGKPPLSFTVSLAGGTPTPVSSPDGAFTIPSIAGTHTLVIGGRSFLAARQKDVTVTEGKATDVGTITVQPGRSISGRVLDETGAPVAGAKVAAGTLLTGGGAELYIADESINAKDAETDADGRFTIDGFPPTPVTIVAGKPELGRSPSVRLPPGPDSATVDLVLAKTSGLDGVVVRAGKPLPDTIVIANPIGATGSNFFVATGADGTFALDALAPGPYIIYPMIGGGGPKPKDMYIQRVEVVAGKRVKALLDATPGPASIAITVNQGGKPIAMAMVFVIEAKLDPKSADELRDFDQLPLTDKATPVYMRAAMGGAAEVTGARVGVHTICAAPFSPGDDPRAPTLLACTTASVTNAAKQSVTVNLPAVK